MAEYIEREATIASIENVLREKADEKDIFAYFALRAFAETLKQAPAADVVEVVRCKDCEYSTLMYGTYVCNNTQSPWFNDEFDINLEANDFCSYGERKEGAEE